MDLWATNLSNSPSVDVDIYDPVTDESLGKIVLEVRGDTVFVRRDDGDIPVVLEDA